MINTYSKNFLAPVYNKIIFVQKQSKRFRDAKLKSL